MDLIFHDELISSQGLHPLLSNPPYNLTLSVAELTTPKERPHVTDNEEETIIPRPHNAFIIFRNDFAAKVKDSPEKKISIRLISQMASNQWRQESESVKLFFKLLADMYQHNHRILYPDYKYSPKYNSRRARRRRSKPKSEELKGKKGRIITWYIHDNTDKDIRTGKTDRYAHLNVFNLDDVKTVTLEENANPCKQKSYPPATFINYTATPTTPLVLHSTTTTSSQPITLPPTNFHHYHKNTYLDYTNNDVISDSASSYYDDSALSPLSFIPVEPMETLSPHSSPPSADECLFWAESSNNNDRGAPSSPFGFDDLFDNQTIFEI